VSAWIVGIRVRALPGARIPNPVDDPRKPGHARSLKTRPPWSWLLCPVLVAVGGERVDLGVAEPVAVALEGEHVGVVDDSIDHRGRDNVVAEHVTPAGEGQVAAEDQRGVFVSGRDQLEEQVGRVLFERYVADLVDLCRARHRSTYADTATMPRACSWALVGKEFTGSLLGIVTGSRGTRGPCPTGGSGPAWPMWVW